MIRETIIPTDNTYTLHFPDEWVGKELSVEIKENTVNSFYQNKYEGLSKEEKIKKAKSFFKQNSIDFSQVTPYTREELWDE